MLFARSPRLLHPFALALLIAACGGEDGGSTPTGGGGGPVVDPLPVQISISPTEVSLTTGKAGPCLHRHQQQPDLAARGSADSGGGSITDGGVYTAPATAGTYRVTVRGRQPECDGKRGGARRRRHRAAAVGRQHALGHRLLCRLVLGPDVPAAGCRHERDDAFRLRPRRRRRAAFLARLAQLT